MITGSELHIHNECAKGLRMKVRQLGPSRVGVNVPHSTRKYTEA